jgi:hypothetical protein
VSSMDGPSPFTRKLHAMRDFYGFDHSASWPTKVRNVSRLGSQTHAKRGLLTPPYEYWYSPGMSQANKTLILYKRHNPSCKVHKTRLARSARRFWMDCECPIWIVGRTPSGDIVPR